MKLQLLKLVFILSILFITNSALAVPKILYINSYHAGYEWSDKAQDTFLKAMKKEGYHTHVIYMDSKRKKDKEQITQSASRIMTSIEGFKPDIIIAADDNASKYIIQPYFKDKSTPVVFHGVNLDASVYGYPYSNATGLVELEGLGGLIKAIRSNTEARSVGMIFANTTTGRKKHEFYSRRNMSEFKSFVVNDFEDFKRKALDINQSRDILAVDGITALEGFDAEKATKFMKNSINIPLVSVSTACRDLVHYGYINRPEEHGAWAARTVKRILAGTKPSEIPIEESSHSEIYINYKMLENSKVKPPERFLSLPHISIQ